MNDVQQALEQMSARYRDALAHLTRKIRSLQDEDPRAFREARRLQAMFVKEQSLIEVARQVVGGRQQSLGEISAALSNNSVQPHIRLTAAVLLSIIDSPESLKALAARVTDKSDTDTVRFMCAMQLAQSSNKAMIPLALAAINHPSTDEKFDDDPQLRAGLQQAGVPTNLRCVLLDLLCDTPVGKAALVSKLNTPVTFQHGWLHTITWLWSSAVTDRRYEDEGNRYIEIAARTLRNPGLPEGVRLRAAGALLVFRREGKGKQIFPRAAWDALHSVYRQQPSRRLREMIEATLKLQGA